MPTLSPAARGRLAAVEAMAELVRECNNVFAWLRNNTPRIPTPEPEQAYLNWKAKGGVEKACENLLVRSHSQFRIISMDQPIESLSSEIVKQMLDVASEYALDSSKTDEDLDKYLKEVVASIIEANVAVESSGFTSILTRAVRDVSKGLAKIAKNDNASPDTVEAVLREFATRVACAVVPAARLDGVRDYLTKNPEDRVAPKVEDYPPEARFLTGSDSEFMLPVVSQLFVEAGQSKFVVMTTDRFNEVIAALRAEAIESYKLGEVGETADAIKEQAKSTSASLKPSKRLEKDAKPRPTSL